MRFESRSYRISRIKRRLEDLSVKVRGRESGGVATGVAVVDAVERHGDVVRGLGRLKEDIIRSLC